MRALVELVGLVDCAYDLRYYHKLQGFVYGLLGIRLTGICMMGGDTSFLCFSNIFPPQDFKRGNTRHFMISSPDEGLLNVFRDRLAKVERVNVGDMSFAVKGVSMLRPRVTRSCTLITATPIIVRIPRENYERYGIKPPKDAYLYRRKNYPFNALVKQLEDNLVKKYNEFYGTALEPLPLFE